MAEKTEDEKTEHGDVSHGRHENKGSMKNPAAVSLGRLGGLAKSERKKAAVTANSRAYCKLGSVIFD